MQFGLCSRRAALAPINRARRISSALTDSVEALALSCRRGPPVSLPADPRPRPQPADKEGSEGRTRVSSAHCSLRALTLRITAIQTERSQCMTARRRPGAILPCRPPAIVCATQKGKDDRETHASSSLSSSLFCPGRASLTRACVFGFLRKKAYLH